MATTARSSKISTATDIWPEGPVVSLRPARMDSTTAVDDTDTSRPV